MARECMAKDKQAMRHKTSSRGSEQPRRRIELRIAIEKKA
jgi:hypothetical protein